MSHIPQYTMLRGGSLVYNRRVPKHAREGFGLNAVRITLGVDRELAGLVATRLTQNLDQLWASPSVYPVDIAELVSSLKPKTTTFGDALDTYIFDKSTGRARNFETLVRRFVSVVPEVAGNKLIADYDRDDARAVVRAMQSRGYKTGTIRRRLNAIRAVMEHAYIEADVQRRNPFSRLTIPSEGADAKKRDTFSEEQLQDAYKRALSGKSEVRLLTPILGEAGARLAEIVGLRSCDVCLENAIIRITPHAGRRLKTRGSERELPLIGHSLEAMHRIVSSSAAEKEGVLLQRYTRDGFVLATHASNALNKWLKRDYSGRTAHCLRHTFRDRLRSVEAPLEPIDQLGGWSSVGGVGSSYGHGYSLDHKREWLGRISVQSDIREDA